MDSARPGGRGDEITKDKRVFILSWEKDFSNLI